MSIESNVQNALDHLRQKDYQAALTCACIAIDATGKAEFQTSSSKDRCRQLINANLDIVTTVGLFNAIYAAPGGKLSLSDPEDPANPIPIENIIYETIRCTLVHEADLPRNVEVTEAPRYGVQNGVFQLPVTLVYALLLVVIGSRSNHGRKLRGSPVMIIRGVPLQINELWGRGDEIRRLLQIGQPSPPAEADP